MIIKIFAIHDAKAKANLPPFFLPEIGMATRTFTDCVNSKEHQFGMHPEDYTLRYIGTYDDQTARIESFDVPQLIVNGLDVKKIPEVDDQIDAFAEELSPKAEYMLDHIEKLRNTGKDTNGN